MIGAVDGSSDDLLDNFARTGHLVPEPPDIAFIKVIDETASKGDLDVGILTGHADESFARELAFQGLGSGQLLTHQGKRPILHRRLVIEVHDAARLGLA